MTSRKRIKATPVAPKLAAVIPFERGKILDEGVLSQLSQRARDSTRVVNDLLLAPITTLETARRVRASVEAALVANHAALHSFFVWESDQHTPHNIKWSEELRNRLACLSDKMDELTKIEKELSPPAVVFELADFRRVAKKTRQREAALRTEVAE